VLGLALTLAPAALADRELPTTTLRGVLFEGFRVGQTEFEVRAHHADVDWNERLATLQSVEIRFRAEERGTVQVRSDRGRVDLDRQDFELIGHVQGTTGKGERFFTDRVRYDQAANSLRGDGPVRIERAGLVFEGEGMLVDLESRKVLFTRSVKATVQPR
jgi:LPS export ABC transporter protein LptC